MYRTPAEPKTRKQHREFERTKLQMASAANSASAEPIVNKKPILGTDSDKQPKDSEQVKMETPKSIPGSITSGKSKRSTSSSIARRKQLEFEAAQAKAQIELALIDKKLEAELALVDAEEMESEHGSEVSKSALSNRARSNVEQWLSQGLDETTYIPQPQAPHQPQHQAPPVNSASVNVVQHPNLPSDSIQQLALTLKDIMTTSSGQREDRLLSRLSTPRDLPIFTGDGVEWLHFKRSYMESTKVCDFSDSENLERLRKALRGDAKDTVTALLIGNTPPADVMKALELRYGRSDVIIMNLTTQLKKLPSLPSSYQNDLIDFSLKVNNCVATIRALNQQDHLRSPELASAVLSKLPSTLIGRWTDFAYQRLAENQPKLTLIAAFLEHEAQMLSLVGVTQIREQNKPSEIKTTKYTSDSKFRPTRPIFTTSSVAEENKVCKFCSKGVHPLPECRVFKRAMRRDKWRFIKLQGLCYCCMTSRHDRNACPAPVCDIDGCGLAHHKMLHWKKPTSTSSQSADPDAVIDPTPEPAPAPAPLSPHTVAHVASDHNKLSYTDHVMLKVVSVQLRGPKGVVSTYALLDDAASVSIIDSDLATELGLKCEQSSAIKFIDAFGLEVYQSDAPTVTAQISGQNNNNNTLGSYDIKLRKVSKLNLPEQNLSVINSLNCQHLSHVKSYVCKSCVKPRILIGEDNYFLIAPIEIINGNKHEPYASRCKLGWSIHGYCGRTHSNAAAVFHLSHTDDDNIRELNDLIKHSFSLDSIGISTLRRENSDHLRALQILDDTSRLIGNQWEVGLPFKKDVFTMPDTREAALTRLQSLMRKFVKDDAYADRYRQEVNKLFASGYARELKENELSADHIWYIPHFGVQNPNKPGKLRLVFDFAAKVNGTCLNNYLLTGPDLYNSLWGIMLRFRENKIVIIGDIKDMFLRVKIRQQDQHVLRFLWQESPSAPIKTCIMQSLPFGGTCSPFIAQYIKNKNASKYDDLYPEAVQVIVNSHYMDDCLYSTNSVENAVKLVEQITQIHKSGGFEIRGWSSNSKEVLKNIPIDALAQTAVQFKDGALNTTERTLGLMFHPSDDTFGFEISFHRVPKEILSGAEAPTKAKMLSLIMSIYDIHGFLSPFIIKSKIIFQNVHRSGVDWNCRIQPGERASWVKWLDELRLLASLRIPRHYADAGAWTRCYDDATDGVSDPIIINTELHAFCDSSSKAFAAVIYWRFTRSDGTVNVCFVASKSRVTPLRPVSIPRLELQGALLSARLGATIQNEHKDIKANKRYFWTDSNTVLQWIRSDPRDFKPYVAHRLGEIDELTTASEWRHVPSSQNAADVATRDDAPPLQYDSVWFQGPNFLRERESEWPKDIKSFKKLDESICERKLVNVLSSADCTSTLPVPNENNFSSWIRLLMTTSRVLLFVKKCRRQCNQLGSELLESAEELLIKKCQHDSFLTDIKCLRQNKPLPKDSRLLQLTPYLDDTGLLRVGGRIDKTVGIEESTKRPLILDGKHRITRLLVEHYHKQALHGAQELVVNELRQRYWILKLRPTVRAVAAHCLLCRYRRAAPQPQRMADLPLARLQHNRRPFSFTGIDFFGPMEVTIGRGRQKRYGMLFTCLTVRAVHIEITESLTTDATIMGLRRMMARRGAPCVIYSDNGTNLRGSDTELKRSIAELDTEALRQDGLLRGIEWRFIPPGAPEMGGAWERMVRTVKSALRTVLKERAPRPETLSTLLAEVEALVNSRPITYVSTDPSSPEALTPNHFLIGTSSNGPAFGKYNNEDLQLKRQWRIAQRLTDMFWSRWLKEYLPTLIPRQKWTREQRSLRVGDFVLLVEPNLERGSWRHGVVSATLPGGDGRVRVVDVRTRTGTLRRPVTRVALLAPEIARDD